MRKYVLKRIGIAIPVLIGITIIDFLIMTMAGSPLEMLQGPRMSQSAIAAREIQLGLDQPIIMQYGVWVRQLFRGNLGFSIKSYQPVARMISTHIGPTLLLMGSSLVISLLIAVPAGIYSAVKQYTRRDYAIVTTSFVASSIPSFFLALVLIYIFTVKLRWLPSSGMRTLGAQESVIDVIRHMAMPVLVLVAASTGNILRYIRSAMLEILQSDYLRTARAKGIGRRRTIYVHALRNALVPILTIVGMQIPLLFSGSVIVEQVFSWPGLGLMSMTAILNRDYPVIMGTALITAVVVLLANLVTDILYAVVDPTIKY